MLTFVVLAVTQTSLASQYKEQETQTFYISKNGTVKLYGDEGNIEVQVWDRDSVQVNMTRRVWARSPERARDILKRMQVEFEESSDLLVIREQDFYKKRNFNFFDIFDGDFWTDETWRTGSIDYVLMVPDMVRLEVHCDEGDINLSGLKNALYLEVDEGDVDIHTLDAEIIYIRVDEGDLYLDHLGSRHKAELKIRSDEGDIHVENSILSTMDIRTDEGRIVTRNVNAGSAVLQTDEGTIDVDIPPERNGRYRYAADEGDVHIRLSDFANADLDLLTEEGHIDTDFDLPVRRNDDRSVLSGKLGDGSANIKSSVDEGDIFLIRVSGSPFMEPEKVDE